MGQVWQMWQMCGRFKFTKLPPTSKLDRLLLSFGGGRCGRCGRHFRKTFRNTENNVTPYPDTGAGSIHSAHPEPSPVLST